MTATRFLPTRRLLALAPFLVAAALAGGCTHAAPPQAPADYAAERVSAQGAWRVSYKADPTPVPVHRLHAWTLHVARPDGSPVTGATINVDGDMPQHGHGLPTRPRVTRELGNGDYLVEGVKFQMGGWWVMDFEVTAAGRTDRVRFNLQLSK
jgi:hypothetical protein